VEAVDGEEGLQMAQNEMPDLIISDIMMPKMDGIQFCKAIKTNLTTCHIPVILLTARTSVENRIEGLETGADSYIPKPFHPQHLRIRVKKLIELRQTLISKFSKTVGFEAKEMTLTSADERFLQKAIELVKENISNPNLNIEEMGTELGMSRVHLYRKLKALTNQTPSEFVRTIRLKQAAYLLAQNKANVSEIAYIVGFSSHQYFTNCFQNYFNMSPKEYSKKGIYTEPFVRHVL
jgi:YesN/AraC family two-component response regulator